MLARSLLLALHQIQLDSILYNKMCPYQEAHNKQITRVGEIKLGGCDRSFLELWWDETRIAALELDGFASFTSSPSF